MMNYVKNFSVKGIKFDVRIEVKSGIDYETLEKKSFFECLRISARKQSCGGGQIVSELKKKIISGKFSPRLTNAEKFEVLNILDIWEKYHLNDMQAGTKAQEKCIHQELKKLNKNYDYETATEILLHNGKWIDRHYQYGTGWLTKEIPSKIINSLKKSIETLEAIQEKKTA